MAGAFGVFNSSMFAIRACHASGRCNTWEAGIAIIDEVTGGPMGPECDMCEAIGGVVGLALDFHWNEDDTMKACTEYCRMIREHEQCNQMVASYLETIIERVKAGVSVEKICNDIGYCRPFLP